MRRLWGWPCVLFVLLLPVRAQLERITIERPFRAQNLSGTVVDLTGAPVPGVVVEDRDAAFKSTLFSTTTDSNGHFVFPPAKNGTLHYPHFESRGFDPMQITVKLHRLARAEVRIRLHVAS
jgi:uncharacterized GH25 family protein